MFTNIYLSNETILYHNTIQSHIRKEPVQFNHVQFLFELSRSASRSEGGFHLFRCKSEVMYKVDSNRAPVSGISLVGSIYIYISAFDPKDVGYNGFSIRKIYRRTIICFES